VRSATTSIAIGVTIKTGIGHWSLVIGHWLLVIGHWLLVIGYWLLVIGYWLLVIGNGELLHFSPIR